MSKITLFLGSSSAAKSQAKALATALKSEDVDFLVWWDGFTPGRTLLGELDSIRSKVDGAILLLSPETDSTVRGKLVKIPNLNVLFEFGYFFGHFGPERVAILRYGEFYLPSDLDGYIHISGSKSFKRSASIKVGKRTITDFDRWVNSAHFEALAKAEQSIAPAQTADEIAFADQDKQEKDRAAARYRVSRRQPKNWQVP